MTNHPPSITSPRHLLLHLAAILVVLPSSSWVVYGYYVGEPVDTVLFYGTTTGIKKPALIAQRPLFGIDSTVTVPRDLDRFSLAFEDGYHQLSWLDVQNLGKLRVTFVHSKSGDGAIHAVFSQPIMKTLHEEYSRHHMEVEYLWIEEQPVDVLAGSLVMFLATLVLTLFLIFHTCCGDSLSSLSSRNGYLSEQDEDENPSILGFQERSSLALHAE